MNSIELEGLPLPKVGEYWQHKKGAIYRIRDITNLASSNKKKFPVTIVYENLNKEVWSRPFSQWHGSFVLINT